MSTTPSPPIDPRDRDALVAQTTALAQRYSGWRPGPGPDAGQALVTIAARFAELVVSRINRAPERNFLAFLNLIGIRPTPPLPARVPLTFTLAEGGPADALVPAGSRAVAAALPGDAEDVVFTTEAPLQVTRARLATVIVGDAENDLWSDRTTAPDPFAAFVGDRPVPHQLHLACDPVFTAAGVKDVTLQFTVPDPAALAGWPISWSYWDGAAWAPASSSAAVTGGVWRVRLTGLPQLRPSAIAGITAGWVRAQLDRPVPRGGSGIAPEAVAVGNRAPQDDVTGLFPFGDTEPARWFYLSADEAIAAGTGTAQLDIALARPGTVAAGRPVRLAWTYKVGSEWKELGRSASDADGTGVTDGSRALTRDGTVRFAVPSPWPRERYRGRLGRWLRVEITDGAYTALPQLATLTAGYSVNLPTLADPAVVLDTAPPALAPPAAFAGAGPLDVTADFTPFGAQPRFGDTFYLACPPDLVRSGGALELGVTLTNAAAGGPVPKVFTGGNPGISWEGWDGTGWRPAGVDDPAFAFTASATLQITPPPGFAPTAVNGDLRHWLRIRLVRGDYGRPADFARQADGTYALVPATLAPPVVKQLTWKPGRGRPATTPVTACVSIDEFTERIHSPGEPFAPFVTGSEVDPALYLGFDQPFSPRSVTLYLQVEPPAPEEVAADAFSEIDPEARAELIWEYSGPGGWQPLDALDHTGTLAGRGTVEFIGPSDQVGIDRFGQCWFWLRARWSRGEFPLPPRLSRVALNTTWALQAVGVEAEILGSGTGEPGQVLVTSQSPVLDGHELVVREADDTWVAWQAVDDLLSSGPADRHHTLDPLSGEIRFGDGHAGRCLPPGANNVRISYRTGGGAQGNRAAHTITTLGSAVPYIDAVTNHEPAQGGFAREPVERLAARGPLVLRHSGRAITARDVEDIAFAASPEVARVAAVPPADYDPKDLWLDPRAPRPAAGHAAVDAGRFGVIVVPDAAQARPAPTLALLRLVDEHLRARCPATARPWVAGPEWICVTVTATVAPVVASDADAVTDRARTALERYLHPLTGGPDGTGWAFGRKPHRSEVIAVVTAVAGVDHVPSLRVDLLPESDDLGSRLQTVLGRSLAQATAQPPAADLRRWLSRALVYSGRHDVTATWKG